MKNHKQNVVWELCPDPFPKNQNLEYLWINSLKVLQFVFNLHTVEDYHNILKLSCRALAFTSYKALLKNKKRSGTSLTASFSAWFLKINILLVIFYSLTKFQCLVAFTSWHFGQYVYQNGLLTRLWCHKFWNLPYLSNQAIFSTCSKSYDERLNILRTKQDFKMKKKLLLFLKFTKYACFCQSPWY